jgi:SAM-dependent methyltransferase
MDLHEVPGAPFRRHPWEIARARFFARLVADTAEAARPARVLDVGAGDGYLARHLLDRIPGGSSVACVDSNYTDDDLVRFADPPAAGLSISRTRPAGAFDRVLLLDVIEHVQDDRALLADIIATSVAPDGLVLVSVPAWDFLYGQHDLALKHFRRYQPAQCRALLESAGLEILRSGGLFHSLLLPRLLQRLGESTLGARRAGRGKKSAESPANLGQWRGGRLISSALTLALTADTRLSDRLARAGRQVPGLSYWALCRNRTAG